MKLTLTYCMSRWLSRLLSLSAFSKMKEMHRAELKTQRVKAFWIPHHRWRVKMRMFADSVKCKSITVTLDNISEVTC